MIPLMKIIKKLLNIPMIKIYYLDMFKNIYKIIKIKKLNLLKSRLKILY